MKASYLLGLMLATSFAFTSCGDDDDNGAAPGGGSNQTKTQMLTAKNYKLTGMTLQGQDVFAMMVDDCQKDDLIKFNTNNTYTTTDAGVACSPTSADSGTWMFMNNETKLQQISNGDTAVADIVQLDASTLKLKTQSLFGEAVVTLTAQ